MPGATVGFLSCLRPPFNMFVSADLKACCLAVSIPFFNSGSALLPLADGTFAKAGFSPCKGTSRVCNLGLSSVFSIFWPSGSGCSSCLASAGICLSSGNFPGIPSSVAKAFSALPGPKPILSNVKAGALKPAEGPADGTKKIQMINNILHAQNFKL